MAAEVLSQGVAHVNLYDAMPSVGRKLLRAGKGGLNLTHSEPYETFLTRYGVRRTQIKHLLDAFGPEDLINWVHGLGINTFVGTSGRLFPTEMKSTPLLRAWLKRLRSAGINFHMRHVWRGWNNGGALCFKTPQGMLTAHPDAVVLALGGGSWARLGSNGAWVPLLRQRGIPVAELRPSNCGFEVAWSEHFRTRFAGHPLKSVAVVFIDSEGNEFRRQGEFIITKYGVEGSLIYSLSAALRDEISAKGVAVIQLDLAPDKGLQRLINELSRPRGSRSMAKHLRSRVGIEGVKAGLLREAVPQKDFFDPARLGTAIKSLQLRLVAPRPLDEAISSAGGVAFEALDERLMVRSMPGVFCSGEMLDWEAPTGGYLLTACISSGRAAGLGAIAWLKAGV
jgi:uncharacterized flavoprotein (TIGR03862 family)